MSGNASIRAACLRGRYPLKGATMNAVLPEMPPSVGSTVALLAGLTNATPARSAASPNLAARLAEEVRAKGVRLVVELQSMQSAAEASRALLREGPPHVPEHSPADATAYFERLAEEVRRLAKAKGRAEQATRMLDKAVGDAEPYSQAIEHIGAGWREMIGTITPAIATLRKELREIDFDALVTSIAPDLQAALALCLAEEGLGEWASRLPSEDRDLVEQDEGHAVHWTAHGWAEGSR